MNIKSIIEAEAERRFSTNTGNPMQDISHQNWQDKFISDHQWLITALSTNNAESKECVREAVRKTLANSDPFKFNDTVDALTELLYATKNITQTEGRELKDITEADMLEFLNIDVAKKRENINIQSAKYDANENCIHYTYNVQTIVGEGTRYLNFIHYQEADYLRSKGYCLPNQYSTPSASVDWDKIESVLSNVWNHDKTVGTAIAYLKTFIKQGDKVGEEADWLENLPTASKVEILAHCENFNGNGVHFEISNTETEEEFLKRLQKAFPESVITTKQ